MSPISNADKQVRFRQKEHLKREADNVFRHWQSSFARYRQSRTPEEVRHALDKAVELPTSWTEEDLQYALKKLGQCHLDLISSEDQIANDVNGDLASSSIEFMTTSDPLKFIAENKTAIKNAKELAAHLISALKISNCNDADQAAALMEAVRFVGQSLTSTRDIRRSQATTMCLASIGPQYDRPVWFVEQLADTIGRQVDKSIAREVGKRLIKES
jgi:hypothetical protein